MPLNLNFLAAIPLAIWLYLLLARGSFWRLSEDKIEPRQLEDWPHVVAVVPARNEATAISQAISSIAKQDYPGEFSIIVVDDHSEDGTAALAQQAANESGASQRLKIHSAAPLAPGWTGKLWALHEGISATSEKGVEFFWFTDADIEHAPDTLRPAGAAGGCILLRRNVLAPIGGIASIRGEVIDDCALARAVKKNGGKIWMGLTRVSVSLRGYGTFAEIRDLIARTAFTQLHYSFAFLAVALAGLFGTFLLPWILFFAYPGEAWLLVDTAIALMTATFLVTVRFYNLSAAWALTLPFAAVFYGYATCVSAVRYWLGRGGQWKGRAQAQNG